jgi:hypothetical protein
MRLLLACACCAVLLGGPQGRAEEASARIDSQKALLKDWALARCLAVVYEDGATKADANATAGAYLERGTLPFEAYEAIERLIEQYAKRSYSGMSKSSFNTMKCIDLFHSAELERLASKLAKEGTPR